MSLMSTCRRNRFSAKLVESLLEFSSDVGGVAMLNIAALQHVDQLAVTQNGNGGRGRRVSRKVAASALGGGNILPGKYADQLLRAAGVLQCHTYCGPHAPGGASAN